MPISRTRAPLACLVLSCLALAACGGDDDSTGPPPPPAPVPTYDISIINGIGYQSNANGTSAPAVDTVAAGTNVRWNWVNTGTVTHNVTAVGSPTFTGSADVNVSGTRFGHVFDTPGTYHYECTMPGHAAAGMIGTLVVQ